MMTKKWWKRLGRRVGRIIMFGLAVLFIFTGGAVLWAAFLPLPDFNAVFEQIRNQASTKIYDRSGKILLYDIATNIRRTNVSLDQISNHLKNATLAIEDDNFYQHRGIAPLSILRAVWIDLRTGDLRQGGSTITQQVIKNSLLSQEKTISRKIKEWILAIKLERALGKDEILNIYLNSTPYGSNIYGAEAAANAYFGVTAVNLSLAQAAYLAALPKAPSFYSPYGPHRDALEARKNIVLKRMRELGLINEEELQAAQKEKVVFVPGGNQSIKAPHFVFYVKDYLAKRFGEGYDQSGLKVISTLDWLLQQKMEALIAREAPEIEKSFGAGNLAMVALDPQTGQILALVGSRDYFDIAHEGNFNVATAVRQPGSAFKPIAYATLFSKGYTDHTVLFDLPTQFSTACGHGGGCYAPSNYTGDFVGPLSLRSALAQSRNIPAIKVLYLAGIEEVVKKARELGVSTLNDPKDYGLALVLGGGGVTLLDLTSAYGAFAADGIYHPKTPILRIEDGRGAVLEEWREDQGQAIFTPEVARTISSILSDNEARAPVFGLRSALYLPGYDVAVKTGTTDNYRDAWAIGYTPSFVLGVWAGNNDNSPMSKRSAVTTAAPVWHALMEDYLSNRPKESFGPAPEPDPNLKPVLRGFWRGNENYFIDKISGKLATDQTPGETSEERVLNNVHSILYWVDRNDPLGPPPRHPEADPQFRLWEEPIRAWAARQGLNYVEGRERIPTTFDDVHQSESLPVGNLSAGSGPYQPQDQITIKAAFSGAYPISRVDFFLNNIYLGAAEKAPWQISFSPQEIGLDNLRASNELKAVATDSVKNKGKVITELRLDL